jgi:hypothetical protein
MILIHPGTRCVGKVRATVDAATGVYGRSDEFALPNDSNHFYTRGKSGWCRRGREGSVKLGTWSEVDQSPGRAPTLRPCVSALSSSPARVAGQVPQLSCEGHELRYARARRLRQWFGN